MSSRGGLFIPGTLLWFLFPSVFFYYYCYLFLLFPPFPYACPSRHSPPSPAQPGARCPPASPLQPDPPGGEGVAQPPLVMTKFSQPGRFGFCLGVLGVFSLGRGDACVCGATEPLAVFCSCPRAERPPGSGGGEGGSFSLLLRQYFNVWGGLLKK